MAETLIEKGNPKEEVKRFLKRCAGVAPLAQTGSTKSSSGSSPGEAAMLRRQRAAAQLLDEGLSCASKAGRPDSNLLLQELMKQHEVLLNANAATELTPPQDKTTRSLTSFCEVIRAQGVQTRKWGRGPPERLYHEAMRAQAGLNLLCAKRALGPPAPSPPPSAKLPSVGTISEMQCLVPG